MSDSEQSPAVDGFQPTQEPIKKDPRTWKTGNEAMTPAQASYLETLATEAGEGPPPADLTKAEASEEIDALQEKTGRGRTH